MFCKICYVKKGEPKLCQACYKRVERGLTNINMTNKEKAKGYVKENLPDLEKDSVESVVEIEQLVKETLLCVEILSKVINEKLWYVNPVTLGNLIRQTLTAERVKAEKAKREMVEELHNSMCHYNDVDVVERIAAKYGVKLD